MWNAIEQKFLSFYSESGGVILTLFHGVREFHLGKNERHRLLLQMLRVGYETVPLAMLIGIFTGMTVALGTGIVLADFGRQNWIASVVSDVMIKEMGPVFTAFIIAARVGAAMTAEIGTMAVNDEIHVLRVLGISKERYLVMPRVIAALTMTPALTAYSALMGLIGGALVAISYFDVSWETYKAESFHYISLGEIFKGIVIKGFVFGGIYSSVCCYKGMRTTGGAEGVGQATTSAVVVSLSGILIANYLLTRFLFG